MSPTSCRCSTPRRDGLQPLNPCVPALDRLQQFPAKSQSRAFRISEPLCGSSPRSISTAQLKRLPALHLRPIDPVVSRGPYPPDESGDGRSNLGVGFALRCFQRLSHPDLATRRCPWRNNRYTRGLSFPVLSYWGKLPSNLLRPRRIETELSHDVLNPARVPLSPANRRTLGTFFSPRMRRADIEVPNPAVDVNSWAGSACYPRGSFYPLSHGPSTRYRRITLPDFRLCSTCRSHSQAPLCQCTLQVISIHLEGTFGRLRYFLGGDRPSQTAHLAGSSG